MPAFREIAPNVLSVSGVIALVNAVPSPVLAAIALDRYLIAYSVGNTTCPISLNQTVSGTELARIYAPTGTIQIDLTRWIQGADNGLSLIAQGVNSGAVSYTIIFANLLAASPRANQFDVWK